MVNSDSIIVRQAQKAGRRVRHKGYSTQGSSKRKSIRKNSSSPQENLVFADWKNTVDEMLDVRAASE